MKWANHKLVTTVVVFAGTGNFLYAAYSFFGSVLPDRLEGKPPKESKAYWKWRSKHRQNTHWTVPYLAIIAILFYLHEVGVLKDLFWVNGRLFITNSVRDQRSISVSRFSIRSVLGPPLA